MNARRNTGETDDLFCLRRLLRLEANECGETMLLIDQGEEGINKYSGMAPYGVRESVANAYEHEYVKGRPDNRITPVGQDQTGVTSHAECQGG